MRRFLRISSSFLTVASLALAIIVATVTMDSTVMAQDPPPVVTTYCGPAYWDYGFNPPVLFCAAPTLCRRPQGCYASLVHDQDGVWRWYCICS